MGNLAGLCSICGKPGMMNTCQLCGQQVCEQCFVRRHGVCIECKLKKTRTDSPKYPIE